MKFDFNNLIESSPNIVKTKLEANKFLRERPDFHPEPSAFEHIKIVTERLISTGNADLIFSGILHDICKAETAEINPKSGWPMCPKHDVKAFEFITENPSIQKWIIDGGGNPTRVSLICLFHMKFSLLDEMRPIKRDRLIEEWIEQGIFDMLKIFAEADNMLKDFDLNREIEKNYSSIINI